MRKLLKLFLIINFVFAVVSSAPVFQDELEDIENLNPVELAEYFNHHSLDGDVTDADEDFVVNSRKRNVYTKARLWNNGVVFYDVDVKYDDMDAYLIEEAMRQFEELTSVNGTKCVQFKKRKEETDYLFISGVKNACFSDVGRKGGKQVTSLGENCVMVEGKILHEFMHVLGFLHEQSRTDRDEYVKIEWNNIKPEHFQNFEKYSDVTSDHMGMPYDYRSVMHYSGCAFSSNGGQTIVPLQKRYEDVIGQRSTLSETDIKKVQLLYKCKQAIPGKEV